MGTRRSRHNKGRKPLYKHFERDTIRQWSDEKPEPERTVFNKPRTWTSKTEVKASPELLPIVARYLETRKQVEARKQAGAVFPNARGEEFSSLDIADHDTAARVQPSERDILLQLFVERKIGVGQLHAGRKWQMFREWATIQPNQTIDWSCGSVARMPYQKRGDLTESQCSAMKHRRLFLDYAGAVASSFLDFCLDADRGRAELLSSLKMESDQLAEIFDNLLTQVCVCFDINQGAAHRRAYRREYMWGDRHAT